MKSQQSASSKQPLIQIREVDSNSILSTMWEQVLAIDQKKNYSSHSRSLRQLVISFTEQVKAGEIQKKETISLMIRNRMASIQLRLSKQLDEILHHPDFQKLESKWRGLLFLINSSKSSERIKIRILNISKQDLLKDFERSVQFDRSILFRHIYESEYGTFGGNPFSFLIGDYQFSRKPKDIHLLQLISKVASAAHSPFISGVHPGLLDMGSFSELSAPENLARIFENREMTKWQSFRKSEDSRYVVLVLPQILLRLPYGKSKTKLDSGTIQYEEMVEKSDAENYLWGNAAYALGQRICNAFEEYGWMARFLGVDGSGAGKVNGLPIPFFDAVPLTKMSTSVYILSSVEKQLSHQGLVCLCHCKMTSYSAFFSAQTVHQQKTYMRKSSNANERLSAMLPHMLTASRFAHYLKSIMRDKVGRLTNKGEIEKYLNNWLSQYVLTQTNVSTELKSQHPLQKSSVKVFDDSERPGQFKILAHIKPHYQLEALNASIRLVSSLPTIPN
ncbi:type VI secretion system contractile sheath large subunit [bacterium]|nr:type VI secretion system contractile sheath large subunit [bacterium]